MVTRNCHRSILQHISYRSACPPACISSSAPLSPCHQSCTQQHFLARSRCACFISKITSAFHSSVITFNDSLCLFFFNHCQNWHFDNSGNCSPLFREQLQVQAALQVIPALLSQYTPTSTGETALSCKSLFLYSNNSGFAFSCKAACRQGLVNDGFSSVHLTATWQWPPSHFVEAVGPTSDGNMVFCHNCLKLGLNRGPGDERQDFSLLRHSVHLSHHLCFSQHTFLNLLFFHSSFKLLFILLEPEDSSTDQNPHTPGSLLHLLSSPLCSWCHHPFHGQKEFHVFSVLCLPSLNRKGPIMAVVLVLMGFNSFLILTLFDNANKIPDHGESQMIFLLVLLEICAI